LNCLLRPADVDFSSIEELVGASYSQREILVKDTDELDRLLREIESK